MSFNVQSINADIYFEFYLNDNFLYRYRHVVDELDVSLKELTYYLTKYVYKQYNQKRITGTRYDHRTELWFSMLVSFQPVVADLDQDEEIANCYPLDMNYSELEFWNNLYLNIIWLLDGYIQKESLLNELPVLLQILQPKSSNSFWRAFPLSSRYLESFLEDECDKILSKINKLGPFETLAKNKLQEIIVFLSSELDRLQEQATLMLYSCDEILRHYSRFVELVKFSRTFPFAHVDLKDFSSLKLRCYFTYFQGDFGMVRPPELEICNRFMAYSLFKPFADGELSGTGFLESLRDEMSNILLQKTAIIDKLNTLQLQAETLWIKSKSSH